MARPTIINLGIFAQGAIPYTLAHTFYQADGTTVIDLSVGPFTPTVKASGPYGQGTPALSGDGSGGVVTYEWDTADFADIGDYELVIWVTDGSRNLESDLFVWTVYDAPGTTGP